MITGSRDLELEEIKRITPNIYALIDSERESSNSPIPKDRREFEQSCKRADINCHVSERRSTENYFTEAAVKKAKSAAFKSLGHYDKLDDAPDPKWGKTENWLIAREMSAEDWRITDIGRYLEEI